MKKWLIYVFSTGVCLWGCTLNEEWTEFTSPKDEVQDMKIELPKSSDDFGQAVADEIEETGGNECGLFGCQRLKRIPRQVLQ